MQQVETGGETMLGQGTAEGQNGDRFPSRNPNNWQVQKTKGTKRKRLKSSNNKLTTEKGKPAGTTGRGVLSNDQTTRV